MSTENKPLPIIEVLNLKKRYGNIKALNGISFSIGKGEIVGFLGPNGAGKSTTLKILSGLIPADSGEAKVCGVDLAEEEGQVRNHIGYLAENNPLPEDLRVIEYLKFRGMLKGLEGSRLRERTKIVLEIPVKDINKDKSKIIFDNYGKELEVSILNGNCKLQWKVDWAMRWYALDIDFEMYGKDLIESAILSTKIIKLIGKKNPSGFAYELFLDEKGEKISKSKGNGITIDQWLHYASPESLSLYMYQNPKRAKKLYKEIVPKAVDEYLDFIEKAKDQNELQLTMNPVWHVHNGEVPKEKMIMSFSMLLNLVETSNADNKELLWKFVKKYKKNISEKDHPIFDKLVGYAIKYFNDVIKLQKEYKKPNDNEKLALEALIRNLDKCSDKMSPEDIQTIIYSTGKENGYSDNLRDWFKLIYKVVFGDENGPRMGFFISFFGVKETKDLILNKIK